MIDPRAGATDAALTRAAALVLARSPRLGDVRLVAVDGPSGSGKTTIAAALSRAIADLDGSLRVAVVSTDLLATWEEPLSWWPLLEEHLLIPLAAGRPARLPVVQWVSGNPRPGGYLEVPVVDVLVLEGVSAGRAAVAGRLSALIWVEVPGADVRLERAIARDGEPMRPFLERWQVQEAEHFAADGTAGRADIVVRP